MKQYIVVNWVFDRAAWGRAIEAANNDMGGQLHAFLEVSESAVWNWSHDHFHESAQWPNMTNLLKFCNMMDVDPRSFFILEDK